MCDGICLFCGKRLQTYERPRRSTCSVCGEEFEPSAACPDGHHVCDGCLRERGISVMTAVCKTTDCRDPAEILDRLMSIPAIPMHGPAHHILVGSALLAAYRNNGGKTDLDASIPELIRRMSQVPGAVCGNWGCCGAALSAGTFASIVLGSGPLEKDILVRRTQMLQEGLVPCHRGRCGSHKEGDGGRHGYPEKDRMRKIRHEPTMHRKGLSL